MQDTTASTPCTPPRSAHSCGSSSPASTRPATPVFDFSKHDASVCSEDDEHTLCGFGDISLSNIYFVPSLPSQVSPRRDDSWMKDDLPRASPSSVRKVAAFNTEHPLPSLIQKILPPSPSTAAVSPDTDFERLVARLRETRISAENPPHPGLTLPSPSKPIQSPQPRRAVHLKALDKLNAKVTSGGVVAARNVKDRGLYQPTARLSAPKPKPKEKPFRGGKLPSRPPLPRWDLHDPFTNLGWLARRYSQVLRGPSSLFMDLRPRKLETVQEEGWYIVTGDWWHTSYESVSWKYDQGNSWEGNPGKPCFRGSLFGGYGASCPAEPDSARQRHAFAGDQRDLTLSLNLCGVQCALDALAVYEVDVGFPSTAPVDSTYVHVDIPIEVDEDAITRDRERWNVYAEELTSWVGTADAGLELQPRRGHEASRVSSPSSSHGGLHRSTSTLSSVDLTDSDLSLTSVSVPSTPKRKSIEAFVDVKIASPVKAGDGHCISSPARPLNASAASFVPSSFTPLNAKAEPFSAIPTAPKSEPSPQPAFANFTFPSLEPPPLPTVKVKKDEEGFYSEAEVAAPVPQTKGAACTFLPPFLQDSPRRKAPASKTRAIVDRLRSSHNQSHSPAPNPPLYDMNLLDERISVSEDDRTRNSGLSTPSSQDDDDDGWINLADADKASKETRARRTRNLFLALTRRRSDSLPPIQNGEDKVDDLEIPVTASPSSSPSPLPSTDDGWIEGPSTQPSIDAVPPRRRTDSSRSRSHRKRRSSHAPPFPPNTLPPQFMSPTALSNPVGLPRAPFHPATPRFPSQTPGSYFYPAYPAVVPPVAYTSYISQLQLMQMQMRNGNAGGGGGRRSTAPHPAEWFQHPSPGAKPFTTANTPAAPMVPPIGVRRDSLW
ncbi:hypothetical protein LshimejAT787_0410040 [Lyophyllum shimeji]|uniref:Uncharacterized protein n=1 Tax=Lyophyllum shimeji TaxID=47721 RepID=A0A9P3PM41_LYOSH|nr:hypothetical protein LshimejAT787_0410040 [Lyophyllum shimeji]